MEVISKKNRTTVIIISRKLMWVPSLTFVVTVITHNIWLFRINFTPRSFMICFESKLFTILQYTWQLKDLKLYRLYYITLIKSKD